MVTTTTSIDARRKLKELSEVLCEVIHRHGGWIVSFPGCNPLRLEVLPESQLPDRLAEFGYKLTRTGTNERLANTVVSEVKNKRGETVLRSVGGGPVTVDVYDLQPSG